MSTIRLHSVGSTGVLPVVATGLAVGGEDLVDNSGAPSEEHLLLDHD